MELDLIRVPVGCHHPRMAYDRGRPIDWLIFIGLGLMWGMPFGGGWIDDVPEFPGAPPWPELAADLTLAGQPTSVDECAQMRLYRDRVLDFWRDHPEEKTRLAVQASRMLWNPFPHESDTSDAGIAGAARDYLEPAFVILLYATAILFPLIYISGFFRNQNPEGIMLTLRHLVPPDPGQPQTRSGRRWKASPAGRVPAHHAAALPTAAASPRTR